MCMGIIALLFVMGCGTSTPDNGQDSPLTDSITDDSSPSEGDNSMDNSEVADDTVDDSQDTSENLDTMDSDSQAAEEGNQDDDAPVAADTEDSADMGPENQENDDSSMTDGDQTADDESDNTIDENSIDYSLVPVSEMSEAIEYCHHHMELEKGDAVVINNQDDEIEVKLIDYMKDDPEFSQDIHNADNSRTWTIHSWAMLSVQKNTEQMPLRLMYEFQAPSARTYRIAPYLIRDNQVYVCLATDEVVDVDYCDAKEGTDRISCFNSLGSMYGEEYCSQIEDTDDNSDCVTGATI